MARNDDNRTVTLWYVKESEKAYYYSKLPPERNPQPSDHVWIPKSQCGARSKLGNEHTFKLPEWLCEEKGL